HDGSESWKKVGASAPAISSMLITRKIERRFRLRSMVTSMTPRGVDERPNQASEPRPVRRSRRAEDRRAEDRRAEDRRAEDRARFTSGTVGSGGLLGRLGDLALPLALDVGARDADADLLLELEHQDAVIGHAGDLADQAAAGDDLIALAQLRQH